MFKSILKELKNHAPYTFMGAFTGIFVALSLKNLSQNTIFSLFYIFHPAHVFLSAFITASMYKLHKENTNIFKIILVGYVGSIGIATLSDSIFPFIGETLLHFPHRELHLGFIEKWYIVNPIAILAILTANIKPFTKFPHSLHVFVSTAASLFHIMMSIFGTSISLGVYFLIIFLLFISVWAPCCFSDIIFPLFFTTSKTQK
jgi:hypothetical protein